MIKKICTFLSSFFARLASNYEQYKAERSFGAARSPQWTAVRNKWIKENPRCAVCGKKGTVLEPNNVHHCQPFHLRQDLELSPENLLTMCREHHLLVGHLMSWSSFNFTVREDSKEWKSRINNRP